MTLLRDLPEGVRIIDEGTSGAPIDALYWFDEEGSEVRVVFADGSIRNGDGAQELAVSGETARPILRLVWGPKRWDERADDAWDAYVAGDEHGALSALAGVDEVDFTGDYDVWTFVELGLVLRAVIAQRRGDGELASRLKALLNVEDRSAHPALSRKVLLRQFTQELPDEPYARLRESARRWARADHVEADGEAYLAVHNAVLSAMRT